MDGPEADNQPTSPTTQATDAYAGKTDDQKRTIRVRASIVTIQKAGQELKLCNSTPLLLHHMVKAVFGTDISVGANRPQIVIATAATFFHRFFACHSFHEFDRLVMTMACLFLASKVAVPLFSLKSVKLNVA